MGDLKKSDQMYPPFAIKAAFLESLWHISCRVKVDVQRQYGIISSSAFHLFQEDSIN